MKPRSDRAARHRLGKLAERMIDLPAPAPKRADFTMSAPSTRPDSRPAPRWRCAVEIFPADWNFPAGGAWIAGWILDETGRAPQDLRAWLGDEPVLGLCGLPRSEIEQRERGRAGLPYAGFSFLLQPAADTTLLRLEARDDAGAWREFFRTAIRAAGSPAPSPAPATLGAVLVPAATALLRLHARHPDRSLATLAGEVVTGYLARPLDCLPNPPFHGALEGPKESGWLRYGRLEVHGWLAHRTQRIVRLVAFVDPDHEFALLHGLPRTGVEQHFADLPGADRAQFVGRVDLPPNAPVPPLLKIFAELDNGERHLVFARRFRPLVIAGNDAPLPPLSRRLFARTLWALRGAATRLGWPLGDARTALAAAREAWAAYAGEAPAADARLIPAPPLPAAPAAPVRVLVVTHNLNFEGAPWFIFELARHLAAQPGLRVEVLSPSEGPLRRAFEQAGLPVRVLDVSAAVGAATTAEFHRALAATGAAIDWANHDLVIANTMVAFWAIHLAAAAGKPSLHYVHESAPVRRFFAPLVAPALCREIDAAFRLATRVVFTADSTRRVHGPLGDRGNFALLPSWIDVARIDAFIAAHPDRAALRRKHGLAPEATLVVNIGSLCERKGQHIFLRAIASLRRELADAPAERPIHFVMVGARPGPYLETLRAETRLHLLDNHIVFVPETPDIFDFYRLADLFVCTSFEESFPRVLLESAAFRLPIVTTDVNGIAEMLRADEAWFTPPGDSDRLADALRAALAAHFAGDTARRDRARAGVIERFGEHHAFPQHVELARRAAAVRP